MLTKLNALREAREEGFTLIELLVVILIIGILAAIAIPVFLNQRKTSNDAAVESDVKNAATAVETWTVSQKGSNIPVDLATLAASGNEVKTSEGVTLSITGTNTGGYCIVGYHENGKNYTSELVAATYDSVAGGLHRDGEVCVGGINNESGTVETPAAMAFTMTGPAGETETVDITAAYNTWGTVTVTFSGSSTMNGSVDAQVEAYCGTTPANNDIGGIYANIAGGYGEGEAAHLPNSTDSGCGAVDGISISTTANAAYSDWDFTSDTGIIPIAGTAPNTSTGGTTEPAPVEYPTTSIAGSGTMGGTVYQMNMDTWASEPTAYTWSLDYSVAEDNTITYTFTTNAPEAEGSQGSVTLYDGGYGNPYSIGIDFGAITGGTVSGTTNPNKAVDGGNITFDPNGMNSIHNGGLELRQ